MKRLFLAAGPGLLLPLLLAALPLGWIFFDGGYGTQTHLLMAASVMAIVLRVAASVAFRRQIADGLQAGAVKG